MKYLYLLMFMVPAMLGAQNAIPNAGFEQWTSGEGFLFTQFQNPTGWGTLNSSTAILGIQTVTRTTNPQFVKSGNSALKLETFFVPLINRPAQGICVTGTININTEQVEGGVPYALRPQSFKGWYQYYPSGADTGQVAAVLTRWNNITQQRDTVGLAGKWFYNQQSTYAQFDAPFDYWLDDIPDTLMVILVSSSRFQPVVGSVLYLDDLEMSFDQITSAATIPVLNWRVFPNPSSGAVHLEVSIPVVFEVFNALGQPILQGRAEPGLNLLPEIGSSGIYILVLKDLEGNTLQSTRLVAQ